ncbi:MAG: PspC domain-containing protein [Bacteroidales bacterium]|nr:PspC domain-containing protein [Candidatus Cryptobacteroides equifaecalis]
MTPNKRLYRNVNNKMIGGVCSGIADYFELDPTIIRLGWVFLSLWGFGVLAYIVGLIIIPSNMTIERM